METGLSAKKKIEMEHEIIVNKQSPKQTKSLKATKFESEEMIEIDKHTENDAQELIISFESEFAKIPREEDLQFLDSVSLYECKIQTILLLQKILVHYTATDESKISQKNQNNTFLGIEIDMFTEILQER